MTSTAITKELFDKAELVSSNDPNLDPSNLVYMDSDSESSRAYDDTMETAGHEVVKEKEDVSNEEADLIHVRIKMEDEFIIEEEPIELNSDSEDDDIYTSLSPVYLEDDPEQVAIKVELDSQGPMPLPKEEPQVPTLDDEQFEIIRDSEKPDEAQTSRDTSLVDHPYSQCEATNRGFCDDIVQNILDEAGTVESPATFRIISKFNEMFESFGFHDAQANLYFQNMKESLERFKKSYEVKQREVAAAEESNAVKAKAIEEANKGFTDISMTETETENNETLEEIVDLPETDVTDTEKEKPQEENVELNCVIEGISENEMVLKLKSDIKKVEDFGKHLSDQALKLAMEPMQTEETVAEIKSNLKTLLKESRTKFRSLMSEINGNDKNINENAKINLLVSDSSDFSSDIDSDGAQTALSKQRILKDGPQTPAIVSSTKEDYEMSGAEDSKFEHKRERHSSSSESEGKTNDEDKEIKKLLDITSLANAKPDRSKKSSKIKKLTKKKTKTVGSDIDLSSDDDSLGDRSSSSSSFSNSATSDEEEQMLRRQNKDIRDDLLASTEASESESDLSSFNDMLSDEEPKKCEANEVPPEKSKEKKPFVNKSDDSDVESTNVIIKATIETSVVSKLNDSSMAVENDLDNTDNDEKKQPRKKIRRNSLEREIFDPKFFEFGTESEAKAKPKVTKDSSYATPTVKDEKLSPQKSAKPVESHSIDGSIDLTMFENSRAMKDIDLQKVIDKRNNNIAGPSSAFQKSTSVINDEDDDLIMISSESENESGTAVAESGVSRLNKRKKLLTEDELQQETKKAQKDEDQRVKRLQKKNDTLSQMMSQRMSEDDPLEEELILDCDAKTDVTIKVHPKLVRNLKAHQREGIKFMYDACFGSISDEVETKSGCILAHCMGLGKTLQLITLIHTIIRYPERLKTQRILIICPKSTIMNWNEEFAKWLKDLDSRSMKIYFLEERITSCHDRVTELEKWYNARHPGVFLINYEAFRNLVLYNGPKRTTHPMSEKELNKLQERIYKCLVEPGPDLVACDEGHIIKNQKNAISRAITKINTRRRIILTGTPIQNNLNEYYSMVDWIKPALLGTVKEFNNLYANPIKDGQCKDSTAKDIKRMKQRSLILNKKLSHFVMRKEACVLKEFLPGKQEYCIFVPLTEVQENLYENFLRLNPLNDGQKLLPDYTALRKIWTHPKVLENAYERAMSGQLKLIDPVQKNKNLVDEENERPDDDDDKRDGDTSVTSSWWRTFVSNENLESLFSSNKLIILFEILKLCQQRNDKVLVFSAFVAVLNIVETFMKKIHNQDSSPNAEKYGYSLFKTTWEEGKDYFRLDGSTKRDVRHKMIQDFNRPNNPRLRCFLISAKAGGQGINLIGANRCVILDTSWNPSSDQQNIFRIYRLGQPKDCYVYRLIALGTMEEKIYSRSVTKQAMSGRVVDRLQIDRHYDINELSELYVLTKTDYKKRPQPQMPSDSILKYLVYSRPLQAYKYHVHDSLLENKPDEGLNEDDIKEAWDIYERELQGRPLMNAPNQLLNDMNRPEMSNLNYLAAAVAAASPLDNASGLFNPLFAPAGYYPNDYLQSLMPFDISGAFRNTLVPTSSSSTISTTNPNNSMLRNQLNPLFNNPMYNFMAPNSSAANVNSFTQKRRPSNPKKQQSSSPIGNNQNNIQNLLSLQSRYNGNISRPNEEIRPRKNSAVNQSILPDIEVPVNRISSPQNKTIHKNVNSAVGNVNPIRITPLTAKSNKAPIQGVTKNALNLSLAKTMNKSPLIPKPQQMTPVAPKYISTTSAQNLIRSPAFTTTTSSSPSREVLSAQTSNRVPYRNPVVAKAIPSKNVQRPIITSQPSLLSQNPQKVQRFSANLPNSLLANNSKLPASLNSQQVTVRNVGSGLKMNPQLVSARVAPKTSTFVPQNRTSGSQLVSGKPQAIQVNNTVPKIVKNTSMQPISLAPIRNSSQSTTAAALAKATSLNNIQAQLQSVQNNKQMQVIKLNSQGQRSPQTTTAARSQATVTARSPQIVNRAATVVRNPQMPSQNQNRVLSQPSTPTSGLRITQLSGTKRPIEVLPSPNPKRPRLETQSLKLTPPNQKTPSQTTETSKTVAEVVEIE